MTAPTSLPSVTPTKTLCACTPTRTLTASPTATDAHGPEVTYFGVARADDLPLDPTLFDADGRAVFVRMQGQGIILVLEGRRGGRPLAVNAYDPNGDLRGVEFLVSRPLGNGSPAVCDAQAPMIGGVPGTNPPVFSDSPAVNDAIDDLGCRVNDGTGAPRGRVDINACTRTEPSSEYGFVNARSELQFCLPIARAWNFPVGDTIVAARVRDVTGAVSPPREIVIRVTPNPPFECDDAQSLGERAFVVTRPDSMLLSSLSGTDDVSTDPWLPGSLRICAGADLGDGLHPLGLREDAVLGLTLTDGTTLCVKLDARGSSGILDCDGDTASDVLAARGAGGATRVVVDTGLGLDAGTGAAVIRAPISLVQLPAGTPPSTCTTTSYPAAQFVAALTTATGVGQILDLDGGVLAEIRATGANFDCSTWRNGGGGKLIVPVPAIGTSAGDVAIALVLAE
jgi:hypothetical protein